MLWAILIFLALITIPAVILTANRQNTAMDALAMHENLKRNHPDDALAQLGPNEFQRAFYVTKRKRGQKVLNRGILWLFLGLIVSIPVSLMLAYIGIGQFVPFALFALPVAGFIYGAMSTRSKLPEQFDQMRTELRL